jgi:hypothetical protein
VIRHRTFRLTLRLRETDLRPERLAPTESASAHRHIGLRGNLADGLRKLRVTVQAFDKRTISRPHQR